MHMAALPAPMQVPAVQVRPAQQGSFLSPQTWQLRAVPPSGTSAQRKPVSQVPAPPAVAPAQQAWFSPPQARQDRPASLPAAAATHSFPAWQTSPAQQAAPSAPQAMQVRSAPFPGFAQPRPAPQAFPAQQAAPAVPHG
jgi:hypothetical protein